MEPKLHRFASLKNVAFRSSGIMDGHAFDNQTPSHDTVPCTLSPPLPVVYPLEVSPQDFADVARHVDLPVQ